MALGSSEFDTTKGCFMKVELSISSNTSIAVPRGQDRDITYSNRASVTGTVAR